MSLILETSVRLSILYLRCGALFCEGGRHLDAAFNSLFEMPAAASRWLKRPCILSILYLRCNTALSAFAAAWKDITFQFSI